MAVLPALIIGFVTLFYNSAGGALVFFGNLIGLLPKSFGAVQDGASLPVFQQLETHTAAVVLHSAVAAILCSAAATLIVLPLKRRNGRPWLAVGLCCLAAAIVGGRTVSLSVLPAIAVSGCQLTWRQMTRWRMRYRA